MVDLACSLSVGSPGKTDTMSACALEIAALLSATVLLVL